MSKTFIPFGKNILVEPVAIKTVVSTRNPSLTDNGLVVSIGDEVQKIKIGDEVGFVNHGLLSLERDGKKYYILPETDDFLMGTWKNEEIL